MRTHLFTLSLWLIAGCEAGQVIRGDAGKELGPVELVFTDPGDTADALESTGEEVLPEPGDEVMEDVIDVTEASDLPASDETTPDQGPDVPQPVSSTKSKYWVLVERYSIDNPGLVPEKFIEQTWQKDVEIFKAFASNTPPPGDFLLHHAEGWDKGDGPAVILVHGSGTDANGAFGKPDQFSDKSLRTVLAAGGKRRVFAVTFAHPFGDNRNQAIVLAKSIEIVRVKTGVQKVSVVAHSKGGIAVLAYVKGVVAKYGVPWEDDIERVVFLGVPLGGMDWSFRHPSFNYPAQMFGLAMPTSWDKVLEYGQWKDITERSIYGGAFNGLLQVLAPWVEQYPLSMVEQDWYTTYHGGTGFISHSKGLLEAIELGGGFLDAMSKLPLPPDLSVAAAAGGNPIVAGMAWESTMPGTSDGLVFVESATDLSEFESAGCKVLGKEAFPTLSHWELLYEDEVTGFVAGVVP